MRREKLSMAKKYVSLQEKLNMMNEIRSKGKGNDRLIGQHGERLECPKCGEQFAHPISIDVLTGDHDEQEPHGYTEIMPHGEIRTHGTQIHPGVRSRGLSYILNFSGECGHDWSIGYLFHKGNTFTESFFNKD
jgi:ribosomal protein S27AE